MQLRGNQWRHGIKGGTAEIAAEAGKAAKMVGWIKAAVCT